MIVLVLFCWGEHFKQNVPRHGQDLEQLQLEPDSEIYFYIQRDPLPPRRAQNLSLVGSLQTASEPIPLGILIIAANSEIGVRKRKREF